mmetsp:Transcript_73799/g.238957  ORF Transcript_73799/g.238957 Transcript_73799/m.238957 type:complete len:88 (-) Transcript_73799:949-1212(-)
MCTSKRWPSSLISNRNAKRRGACLNSRLSQSIIVSPQKSRVSMQSLQSLSVLRQNGSKGVQRIHRRWPRYASEDYKNAMYTVMQRQR